VILTKCSSKVIDRLIEKVGDSICAAYLYYDYRDEEQRSPVNMAGALLKQVIATFPAGAVPKSITEALKTKRKEHTMLKLEYAIDILQMALEYFSRAYICIDALDECKESYQAQFLKSISELLANQSVRVFITGRHVIESKIDKHLISSDSMTTKMKIEANAADVRAFIQDKIDNHDDEEVEMSDAFKEEIIDTILASANGM
jgi:hypothetical protein